MEPKDSVNILWDEEVVERQYIKGCFKYQKISANHKKKSTRQIIVFYGKFIRSALLAEKLSSPFTNYYAVTWTEYDNPKIF